MTTGKNLSDREQYILAAAYLITGHKSAPGIKRINDKKPEFQTGGELHHLAQAVAQLRNITGNDLAAGLKSLRADWPERAADFDRLTEQIDEIERNKAQASFHDEKADDLEPLVFGAVRADFDKVLKSTRYCWQGWLISGVVNVVAARGGVGKSRFLFDLGSRVYRGSEWPDGTEIDESIKGKSALWIPSDGNYDQLFELMDDYELPEDSTVFIGTNREPYGPTLLDNPNTMKLVLDIVRNRNIWAVIVDTIGRASESPNPYGDEVMTRMLMPLQRALHPLGIPIIVLSHLNKDGTVRGLTLENIARSVMTIEQETDERRRLHVTKTQGLKPPALSITMRNDGIDYEPAGEPSVMFDASRLKGPEKAAYDYLANNPGASWAEMASHLQGEPHKVSADRAKTALHRMIQKASATKDDSRPPKWYLQKDL